MSTSTTIIPGQRPSTPTYAINYVYDRAFTWYNANTVPANVSANFNPSIAYKPFGGRAVDVDLLEAGAGNTSVSYTVLQLVNNAPAVVTVAQPAVEAAAFNCFSAAQFTAIENTSATDALGYQNTEPLGVPVALLPTESIISGPLPGTWEIGNTANGYSPNGLATTPTSSSDSTTLTRILNGINAVLTALGKPTV